MKKIIVVMAMLLCSFSVKANDGLWNAFIFYNPEASECELLREAFVNEPDIYSAIPDNLTPDVMVALMESVYVGVITEAGVIPDDSGKPWLVYGRTKDDLPGKEPSILFMVVKGHAACEKSRSAAMKTKIEILSRKVAR